MNYILAHLGAGLAGCFVGATSVGGFLVAPILITLLGVRPVEAVTITLGAFVPSGIVGSIMYHRLKLIDFRLASYLMASGIPGILAGLWGSQSLSDAASKRVLALLLLATCLQLVYRAIKQRRIQKYAASGSELATLDESVDSSSEVDRPHQYPVPFVWLFGTLGGAASTLAGVGGPVVFGPALIAFGVPVRVTAGTGIFTSTLFAAIGLGGHSLLRAIDIQLAVSVAIAYTGGMATGAWGAGRIRPELIFPTILFLCAIAIVMLVR